MEFVRKDELFSVSKMNFANRNPHAQAPSVPIRRAGRRARDEIRVLPTAIGGEKSPSGGIGGSSVAPLLHRKSLREVRLSFSLAGRWCVGTLTLAAEAVERHARQLLFWNFFLFGKEKSALSPCKGRLCADGSSCGVAGGASPSPTAWNEFCTRTGGCAEMECTRAPSVTCGDSSLPEGGSRSLRSGANPNLYNIQMRRAAAERKVSCNTQN